MGPCRTRLTAGESARSSTGTAPVAIGPARPVTRRVGLGFQYVDYQFTFKSQNGGSNADSRTNRVDPLSAFSFGVSNTIALDEPDRIAIGFGLFMPTRHVANIEAHSPTRQPEWALFGDHQDRL